MYYGQIILPPADMLLKHAIEKREQLLKESKCDEQKHVLRVELWRLKQSYQTLLN